MTGLALATCDRSLAPGTRAPGGAPEWVHLFPEGRMTGRDGRSFDLADAGGVMLAFQSAGIDLPVDYEHQNDRPEAKLSGPVPAAGWIKELRADDTGLWGRVEWTATAAELITNREYRYISPSFLHHPKTGATVRLKGAGLVHNPNLALTALASQDDAMMPAKDTDMSAKPQPYARLAAMLKLPADATEEQLLAALMDLLKPGTDAPDSAKFVSVATVQAMLAERNLSLSTASESRAAEKVADATRRGYLSPAMRGWATALCRTDEASFDAFLSSTIPPFARLWTPTHTRGAPPACAGPAAARTDEAAAICAQLGLAPGALDG